MRFTARSPGVKHLFSQMTPVKGEVRRVYRCKECGRLYGRRFIPYGLGFGVATKLCFCQLVSSNAPSELIAERSP